jgi:choline monooxygenase
MSASAFEFETDLSMAATIPSSWYLDPALLEKEQERVFGRSWQLVGHTEQVRIPGDYFTCTVAGEPVVVTRSEDGVLRALSNVCRHRAGPVAHGAGHRKALQCGYHGWTYSLNGDLRATPEWEGVRGFDRARQCLPSFRVDVWGPFLFVNLDPAAPSLAESLGTIPEETRSLPLEHMRLFKKADYEVACNWKVYVDNYLEGYHILIVHPELFRQLDYRAYRVETAELHSKQHAPIRTRIEDSLYHRNLPEGGAPEALYYWLFPNLMLNFYPDNLQTNVILPLSHDRTLTRFEWYVLDPQSPGVAEEFAHSFAFSDQVQKEDIHICEEVQKGLRSRTYQSGRYSVLRENGVHHFHGLLAKYLGERAGR